MAESSRLQRGGMAVLLSGDGGSWVWPHGRDRPRVWVERSWLPVPRGSHKPLRAWRRGATVLKTDVDLVRRTRVGGKKQPGAPVALH